MSQIPVSTLKQREKELCAEIEIRQIELMAIEMELKKKNEVKNAT